MRLGLGVAVAVCIGGFGLRKSVRFLAGVPKYKLFVG
jgi:hypothetical protein